MEPSETERQAAVQLMGLMQKGAGQGFITNDRFYDEFQKAKDWGLRCLEDDGEVTMSFMLHGRHRTDKNKWIVLPCVFADWPPPEGKKYEAMQGLGVMFVDKYPEYMLLAIYQVAEGWIARYSKDETGKPGSPYLPKGIKYPSERPDKVEALIISGTTMDQRHSMTTIEMVRDQDGTFTGMGDTLIEDLYDAEAPAKDPRDAVDFLTLNIYMGYFAVVNKGKERK